MSGVALPARPGDSAASEVWLASGSRAAEAVLLSALGAERENLCSDPGRLAQPLRILVPSGSLRDHICARLVRDAAGPWLGLSVDTFAATAESILDRAGQRVPRHDSLFGMLVRQTTRDEPALIRDLGPLEGGDSLALASVSDLLDAGLEAAHFNALVECLDAAGAAGRCSRAELERALGLVRSAVRTRERLVELGVGRDGDRLEAATTALRTQGAHLLHARRLFIYGVADTTGRLAAFIEAILSTGMATLLIDRPPDPAPGAARPARPAQAAYLTPLLERTTGLPAVHRVRELVADPAPPALELLAASGAQSEVRAVAARIRACLDAGQRPEGVGVVCRSLESYMLPIRLYLERFGIPFSGRRPGPLDPAGRSLRALAELLRKGAHCPVDRWLDALAPEALEALDVSIGSAGSSPTGQGPGGHDGHVRSLRSDLAVTFHALGAGRLGEVAELDLATRLGARQHWPLPVPRALDDDPPLDRRSPSGERAPAESSAGAGRTRPGLGRAILERAVARARTWVHGLPQGDAPHAELQHLLQSLRDLVGDALGWSGRTEAEHRFAELVRALEQDLPGTFTLGPRDLRDWIARSLEAHVHAPLGGRGAGVQVLDVMEARGRTFDVLFLLGMNRDGFPRGIAEDPMLSDGLRAALRVVLPDVPLKLRGHQEEVHLFADLLSSSPRVVLSWQTTSDDGSAQGPSPFVERLRLSRPDLQVTMVAPLYGGEWARCCTELGSAHEMALAAALHSPRQMLGPALSMALSHRGDADRLATVRLRILEELDPSPSARATPGPYFGFVGTPLGAWDPRTSDPAVTTLEALARCPWQTFLRRVLRVEPAPDALEALPSLDSALVGTSAHRALESIARRSGAGTRVDLGTLLEREGRPVAWPGPSALREIVLDAARETLEAAGLGLTPLVQALAVRIEPFVKSARSRLAREDGTAAAILGAEVRAEVALEGAGRRDRRVRLRADWVERRGETLALVDFKTGRPLSSAARPATRRGHLLREVSAGRTLQAAAYAAAAAAAGAPGIGEYVYLAPDVATERARIPVEPGDRPLETAFRDAAGVLLRLWESGPFVPRLVESDLTTEPSACRFCEVAEACLRHDSGARHRLVRAIERARDAGDAPPSGARAEAGSEAQLESDARRADWLAIFTPGDAEVGGSPRS